jgi:hypothetical protein
VIFGYNYDGDGDEHYDNKNNFFNNSLEQHPSWEAYSRLAIQEILRPLWNPPLDHVFNQTVVVEVSEASGSKGSESHQPSGRGLIIRFLYLFRCQLSSAKANYEESTGE